MDKLSIVDFGLSSMSMEYKREFFYKLDFAMKQIHESGGYVSDFNPNHIYIDDMTRTPSFDSIYPFSYTYSDINDLKKANMLWLADLAFCTYLPDYDLSNGLLNPEVLSSRFDDFKEYFPEDDVDYYRNIFTMDYSDSSVLVAYYSDYINKKMENGSITSSNTMSYVKSTPIGKAMAANDNEAGYINYVFITSVVCAVVMLSIFAILYFMGIFA